MDEKKKKGKKKKGNQSKHSGSIFIGENVNQAKPNESVSNAEILADNNHDTAPVQNHRSGSPNNADSQSVGVSESDVDQEKQKNLEAKCVELQEEINKLEENIWSQKELYKGLQSSLEERIKLIQNEVDSCILKEASLEEKIDDLHIKNALLMTKEGSLEERIKLLQNEVDSCIQKENAPVENHFQLGHHHKANFKERVKQMEEMNHSFALEESSIKEVLSRLGDDNEGLQMQVMELKDSRDSLAQENKQLTDIISTLESRIQQLEMVTSFYASSKASSIHVESVQLAGTSENSTVKSSTSMDNASELQQSTLEYDERSETMPKAGESLSANGVQGFGSTENLRQIQLLGLGDSEDVVSVPMEDIIEELEPAAEKMEAEPVVPFSDAPLIGAPFRLISFVTRFVSGADLVDHH